MDDQPEVIRSQMDQTRSELTEKLETLEHRVSEGMQSTGAAVSDTMTSVRDAVQSVSETLDFRLQVQRHPWVAFSGAVALGYLAASLLQRSTNQPANSAAPTTLPSSPSQPVKDNVWSGSASRDHWAPLREIAIHSLAGVMHEVAAQGVPLVLDYLLSPREEPAPPKPTIAPATATLPLSSKIAPGTGRPLARQIP